MYVNTYFEIMEFTSLPGFRIKTMAAPIIGGTALEIPIYVIDTILILPWDFGCNAAVPETSTVYYMYMILTRE